MYYLDQFDSSSLNPLLCRQKIVKIAIVTKLKRESGGILAPVKLDSISLTLSSVDCTQYIDISRLYSVHWILSIEVERGILEDVDSE